jgi:Arc/MetJ-type ribon-helix-helix transcriptional regulator
VVAVTVVMYPEALKTITITIPDELDAEAAAEAKRLGISKSELIRRGLTALLPDRDPETEGDPWRRLAGFASGAATAEPGEIDRVVYDS